MEVVDATPLDEPANAAVLDELCALGLLEPAEHRQGVLRLRSPEEWREGLSRLLLLLGSCLSAAGVLYFFAYNWEALGRFARFGILEAALVATVLGSAWKGHETTTGQVLEATGVLLLGIFLAVFGQVYQTGADAWTFFAAWLSLSLPWIGVSRSGATWCLGWVLVNLTLGTWMGQFAIPAGYLTSRLVPPILLLVNAGFLLLREFAVLQGLTWLQERWTRWLPLAASLGLGTLPAAKWISRLFLGYTGSFPERLLAPGSESLVLLLALWAVTAPWARYRARDLVSCSLIGASVGILLYAGGFELLSHGFRSVRGLLGFATWMVLAATYTVSVGWAVTFVLRGISLRLREEEGEDQP